MARNLRLLGPLLALVVQVGPVISPETPPALTDDQRAFVAWGEGRFAAAGLSVPETRYRFHENTEACRWHRGLYHSEMGVVSICTMHRDTLLHELAHAWVEAHLSDADKDAFLRRRGLPTWSSHRHPWEMRGTEHAAEILAWGLAPDSHLVRWVDYHSGGETSFRLLEIDDSQPHQLWAEYRRLTGSDPVLRHPNEWSPVEAPTSLSPESAR